MRADAPATPSLAAPLVTVIIPAYGVNAYIEDAINSVLAQTYKQFEVVVINDGAPADETAELQEILSQYDDRVVYMERPNGGQGAARNTVMRAVCSEFVAFLDGDDFWAPTFLERQMALFQNAPSLTLAYTDLVIFGDTITAGSTYMERDPSVGEVNLENLLAARCNVAMSTIVARRQSLIDAGMFDESLRYCEDVELWFRMAYRGMQMTYLPEPLAFRRVRADALTANEIKLNTIAIEVLERFERTHALSKVERDAWYYNISQLTFITRVAQAKQQIRACNYAAASELLESLNPEDVRWKIRAARILMRIAPSAVRRACLMLDHFYRAQKRRHVQRADAVPIVPSRPLLNADSDSERQAHRIALQPTTGSTER